MSKVHQIVIIILLACLPIEGKTGIMIDKNTSIVTNRRIQNDFNSTSGYFKVTKIFRYSEAYFIHCEDTVSHQIFAIISLKSKYKTGNKIKQGRTYYFSLNYYTYHEPNTIYIGGPVLTFYVIDNTLVKIENKSPDRIVVTTPCLMGLRYVQ